MKNITKIVLISIVIYSCIIGLTLYLGGFWVFLTFIAVLGLGYDIHSYIRLRQGKPIITYQSLRDGFYIGDKKNRRLQDLEDENKYICAYCGGHVNKVTFDEDRDNDFCDDCY